MKIYEVDGVDKKYSHCYVDSDLTKQNQKGIDFNDKRIGIHFKGTSQKDIWFPRTIAQVPPLRGKKKLKPVGDFSSLVSAGGFFINDSAVEVLKDFLVNTELLPIDCAFDKDYGRYHALNVLAVLACLDLENSEYNSIPDGEGGELILSIHQYALKKNAIEGVDLFKIQKIEATSLYVSQNFVDRVNEHGLTGFDFRLIWEG